ncbi:MAG: hypothetical protein IJ284_04045 [Clostridia bacterium]|nr:hypothetical protein [Clostridia bacterium]
MKKKLVSMLALSMCFCVGVSSFAGCKDGDDSSTGGGGGGNTPLTQEQILAKVVEAADASVAYQGAYTITMVNKHVGNETSTRGEEKEEDEGTSVISVDAAAGKMLMKNVEKETYDGVTETGEQVVKYFKEGDKNYSYMKQKQTSTEEGATPFEQEMYSEVSAVALQSTLGQYSLSSAGYFNIDELGLSGITTIEAYNAAWATVIADSKAAIAAGTNDEESEWYKCSGDASYVASCTEADGAYLATTTITMSWADEYGTETATQTSVLTVKDGKIVSMKMTASETEIYYRVYEDENDKYGNSVTSDTEGAVKITEVDTYEYNVSFNYAFADTEYADVTTTLPTDATQIMPASDYFSKGIKTVINGVDCGTEYLSGTTVEGAMESVYTPNGMDVVWYKDAACTQAIDATLSVTDLLAMDTMYGKATAEEGFVLYTYENTEVFGADVTDAYKLVFGNMLSSDKELRTASVEGGIYLYKDSDQTVTVNGTEVTFAEGEEEKQYEVVAGQTYEVKKTTTYAKADLNFFDWM